MASRAIVKKKILVHMSMSNLKAASIKSEFFSFFVFFLNCVSLVAAVQPGRGVSLQGCLIACEAYNGAGSAWF